jgi:hypothetical protein
MSLHKFSHNELTFEIGIPDGQDPEQAQHEHLLRVDPSYRWLAFRRALIASQEYPLALSLACSSASLSTAFQVLNSAIDFCCHGGVEPEEIAAFQSAIALYLQLLPNDQTGQEIADRLTTLCTEYQIPTP